MSHARLIEGKINNSNQSIRCLFIENSNYMSYVSEKIFEGKSRILNHSRVYLPSVNKIIRDLMDEFDLCVAIVPKRYDSSLNDLLDFRSDEYVSQVIDIAGTMDDVKKRFHQKKRQLSNKIDVKSGFSYKVSKDLDDFSMFYNEMFLPLITRKYGDNSDIEPYEDMKILFQKGFLVLVSHDNKYVSGALCIVENNSLVFRRSGVLHGDDEYIKLGAQNALYLFNIYHAKDLDLKSVDTMKSMAVLNDGVFRTKREWGATVYPDGESKSRMYLFIPRYSDRAISFFESNPMIVHANGGLCGLVGHRGDRNHVEDIEADLKKKYFSPGLNGLLVITPDSRNPIHIPFVH